MKHRDLSSSRRAHKTWNVLVIGKGARKSLGQGTKHTNAQIGPFDELTTHPVLTLPSPIVHPKRVKAVKKMVV